MTIRTPVAMAGVAALLVAGGVSTASAHPAADATSSRSAVAACTVADLQVAKGKLEGAAGSRFQKVRVTNTSEHDCATLGFTRYRFRNHDGPIGFRSTRNPASGDPDTPVVIEAGATAKSVLSWVDPGPTVPSECKARRATAFRFTINDVEHHYRLPISASVCTTRKYRPHGTRLTD